MESGSPYSIDPDITVASTLDARFYSDADAYAVSKERIFARSWQWLGDLHDVEQPGSLSPRDLLAQCLDEPLLLSRDSEGKLRCLSNVCTHRGNILIDLPCKAREIRCKYHSRRFDLAGRLTTMPDFKEARNFPTPSDDLPHVPLFNWHGHGFACVDPVAPATDFLHAVDQRLAWLPIRDFRLDPGRGRTFEIDAHWALYVENYLEGFHIPFVHPELNKTVDYGSYASELFRYSNLQLALAKEGETAFEIPTSSPDHGQRVAAYYFWVFPNLMLNFYPWGLSVNLVQPLALNRTRITFRSYVWREDLLDCGAGSGLDRVEAQDEAIILQVQRGVRSRFYRHGRYSPTRERGVHHFHSLLCDFLN